MHLSALEQEITGYQWILEDGMEWNIIIENVIYVTSILVMNTITCFRVKS